MNYYSFTIEVEVARNKVPPWLTHDDIAERLRLALQRVIEAMAAEVAA